MSNFNVSDHTIFLAKHGSRAYGLATEDSDLDIKGVCIPPLEYHLGFLHTFEQQEHMGSKDGGSDRVVYSLKKFAKLAADCNPSIVEVLFVDECDVLFTNEFGRELLVFRDNFLSTKARHTFSGYAHSQLKKIKSHRRWLLTPPKEPPSRKDFGLAENFAVNRTELGAFEALERDGEVQNLSAEAQVMFTRERSYKAMLTEWNQYQDWKKNRNPKRAVLEAHCGYDAKHASHLIRLMRMCKEILITGKVIVKRPDREELLLIKHGLVPYEQVIEESEHLDAVCESAYKDSPLPKSPNLQKIDDFVVGLTQNYLTQYG